MTNNNNAIEMYEHTTDNGEIIAVISSLEVAENFDKRHDHVLDTIDSFIERGLPENSGIPFFIEDSYKVNGQGRSYRQYYLTKDGFSLTVMSFTGKKAHDWKLKYIAYFNEMEAYIKEQHQPVTETAGMIDSTMMYQIAQSLEEKEKQVKWQQFQIETQSEYIEEQSNHIEQQAEYIEEVEPKALFADSVGTSEDTILVGELAKILAQNGIPGMGQNRLFKWLRNNGFLLSRGVAHNTPSQRAMEMELFRIQERTIIDNQGRVQLQRTPRITGKGQLYFINRLTKLHESGVLEKQMNPRKW